MQRDANRVMREAKTKTTKKSTTIELEDRNKDLAEEEHVVEVLDIEGLDEALCCICMDR